MICSNLINLSLHVNADVLYRGLPVWVPQHLHIPMSDPAALKSSPAAKGTYAQGAADKEVNGEAPFLVTIHTIPPTEGGDELSSRYSSSKSQCGSDVKLAALSFLFCVTTAAWGAGLTVFIDAGGALGFAWSLDALFSCTPFTPEDGFTVTFSLSPFSWGSGFTVVFSLASSTHGAGLTVVFSLFPCTVGVVFTAVFLIPSNWGCCFTAMFSLTSLTLITGFIVSFCSSFPFHLGVFSTSISLVICPPKATFKMLLGFPLPE